MGGIMKIIGIDQSSTSSGVSFFVNGKLKNYTLIKPKSSKRADEIYAEELDHTINIIMPEEMYSTTLLRITVIVDQIEKLIEQFKPDVVYFEEIFVASRIQNISGFRSLARLQGFLAHCCWKHKRPYVIVEENKWINSFGTYSSEIKRPERKADIMNKINEKYGLDIKTDDISDAIAIGDYAIRYETNVLTPSTK